MEGSPPADESPDSGAAAPDFEQASADGTPVALVDVVKDAQASIKQAVHRLRAAKNPITNALQLIIGPKGDVCSIAKISNDEYRLLLEYASSRYAPSMFRASDLLAPQTAKLSLSCPILDEFLRGGIMPFGITEISGEAGTGKSQLCLQLAIRVHLPISEGGLEGGCLYIATEGDFPATRFDSLIRSFKESNPKFSSVPIADDTLVRTVATMQDLSALVLFQIPLLLKTRNIKLIIIDSIAALARFEYSVSDALEKGKTLWQIASQLKRLSSEYNFPVVITNQMTDRVDDQKDQSIFGTSAPSMPALGFSWSNAINSRFILRHKHIIYDTLERHTAWVPKREADTSSSEPPAKRSATSPVDNAAVRMPVGITPSKSSGAPELEPVEVFKTVTKLREMKVEFAPHLPNGTCSFVILKDGVRGVG